MKVLPNADGPSDTHRLYTASFKKAATMSQKKVVEVFRDMDEVIESIVYVVLQCSDYFQVKAGKLIWEVSSSLASNRNLYRKLECRHRKTGLISAEDLHFTEAGFTFLRQRAFKQDTVESFFDLHLLRSIYEQGLQHILKLEPEYAYLYAKNMRYVQDVLQSTVTEDSALRNSDVTDRMQAIEDELHTNRTYLYNMMAFVKSRYLEYSELRNSVVNAYLRIVFSVASEFAVDENTMQDHYQVGILGLLRAISNYNPDKGSFSAYAKLWIRQAVLSSIKDMNIIKIPASTWQCYTTLERRRNSMRTNDMTRLSAMTGISEDRIADVYDKVRTSQVCRLDAPLDDGDGDFEDSGETHSYEEIIEDKYEQEEETYENFDHVDTPLARKVMICCHGDLQDLVKCVEKLPTQQEIFSERVRQQLAIL